MPKLILPIPETELSVTRPVVLEVSRKLFKAMGLNPNTQIFYPGDGIDKVPQAGTTLGITETDEPNMMPFNQRIKIEVDEQYEADRLSSTAIHRAENFPIFMDESLNTTIKPIYSSTEFTLNFKFRAADKTLAKRWRDEIRIRCSDQRELFEHSASFHWEPPVAFMRILGEIHRLRENVLPYGEDFETYFQKFSDKRASVLTTLAGTDGTWEISETQGNIIGYFDFTGGPDQGSKEDDGDTWTTSFSYKFRFEKPLACTMHYPIIVHNQILGQQWRPSQSELWTEQKAKSYSLSSLANQVFRQGLLPVTMLTHNGYSLPNFDEFIPRSVPSETLRVFTVLVRLNLDDRKDLINLAQLGKVKFTDVITAFLKKEAAYMTKPYNSVFSLSLYDEVALQGGEPLTVDADLNVRSKVDLDPRRQYHVRLALVTDWNLLPAAAIKRMQESGAATLEIIKAIDPTFSDNGKLPVLVGPGFIKSGDIAKTIDTINSGIDNRGQAPAANMFTVGTLFINAHHKES